jgi:hypothetical protein
VIVWLARRPEESQVMVVGLPACSFWVPPGATTCRVELEAEVAAWAVSPS